MIPQALVKKKRKTYAIGKDVKSQLELHSMLLPGALLIGLFSIIPLFGLLIAFKDYNPISGISGIFASKFNHFDNFKQLFRSYQFWPMIRNTLGINLIGQLVTIPVTLMFALLLNELTHIRFRSFVQTVTYLPHFLSWVIYGGLCINLLTTDNGVINNILLSVGVIQKPISFMGDPSYFWGVAIITALCKEIGWGAILYLAAMAGIDQAMYEAATIDGAGRFKKMWYVTLPSILPTVMIMLIFAISGMLNNNFTQIYVFQNALNQEMSQVIDTYVYQIGLQQFQFDVATATTLMKSIFALMLLVMANFASNKLTETGLF